MAIPRYCRPDRIVPDPTQTNCPGATVIPLAERFLAGGGNSHRGFGLNQAGPRDPVTGFPLGGSALFLNNLELRFPPTTLPYVQDNISFALFWDAGNVFVDGRHMLDNLLRWRQRNPEMCLQRITTASTVRFRLCQPCSWGSAPLPHADWTGALRFRVQSKSTSVSKLSGDGQHKRARAVLILYREQHGEPAIFRAAARVAL